MQERLFDIYWGKARPAHQDGPCWHPLAYHSLDVAAVGAALLERDAALRRRLALATGLPEAAAGRWLRLCLALHDVGKFSHTFQALVPELFRELHGGANRPRYYGHDGPGFALYDACLRDRLSGSGVLWTPDGHYDRSFKRVLDYWMRATTGHHGRPPRESVHLPWTWTDLFDDADREAALAFAEQTAAIVAPGAPPEVRLPGEEISKHGSWFVAGLATLCDWIGSNQTWFPYQAPDCALDDYWQTYARPQAARAIAGAGILPARPASGFGLADLIPAASPSPLQEEVTHLPLGGGPTISIVEDLTGSGKTEAALLLAHRLMVAGHGAGIMIALPTRATANAMYGRFEKTYRRLFAAGEDVSLVLSHAASDLAPRGFTKTILHRVGSPDEEPYGDEADSEDTASAACNAWIANDRRRASQADVGVTTIDQAVMAVLPTKFQSLRLVGTVRRVLIVDEVHAYDEYLGALLRKLLRFHAALGGSAILLSATLPKEHRQTLLDAFARGREEVREVEDDAPQYGSVVGLSATAAANAVAVVDESYPLLTRWQDGALLERPIEARGDVAREVSVDSVANAKDAVTRVIAHARAGRCVCWLRNTVGDAHHAFACIREAAPELRAMLFHSRFTVADRMRVEGEVQRRFGRDSAEADRAGQVLVATQVVEQSLDIDFDAMVTDLAPIDLIIQRAGRLWRHRRAWRTGGPCLEVMMPQPDENAGTSWYSSFLPQAAHVYKNHARLWLTARILLQKRALRLPEDARELVETVYGPGSADDAPAGLASSALTEDGRGRADAATGSDWSLKPGGGYVWAGQTWEDEGKALTRLEEVPQVVLRLARWQDGCLRPWAEDGNGRRAWRLSEVRASRWRIAKEGSHDRALAAAVEATKKDKKAWPERYDAPLLIPLWPAEGGGWVGKAIDGRDQPQTAVLTYDKVHGLVVPSD